ncbi:probable 4-coumarate--CoA ligase 1 [Haliotis rubra]|uniref:probable 4-coumarate--CoA ligase 1 n=1 Tax=Haliotis rubra TaxID=36100 RepID=UPI001EE5C632|nr:probable 4-coumarate--CoA ligase 1 [Haliotis rubra]XP_046579879.1 probable 4-coumarate--CoA ligase 1 [Haliotis rubra]XP_046579881.1 probable 4-coumarate--CoA ligase 1 [Haliotis rubra]XP_046579882.1 probable 4-coumarate--CoA ligase 1 [Haliotis rubra]
MPSAHVTRIVWSKRFPLRKLVTPVCWSSSPLKHSVSLYSSVSRIEDQMNQTSVVVPKDMSISQYLLQDASKHASNTALIDGKTDRRISFERLQDDIHTLTSAFYHLGLRHRDIVTMYATNVPEIAHVFCSVTDNGAALSLANSQLTADDLASQLRQTRSRLLITTPDCADTALAASALSPYTQEVICIGQAPGCRPLSDLLQNKHLPSHPRIHIKPDSTTALIPFSSGTTGLPKGVMLSHYNIISDLCQLRHPLFLRMSSEEDVTLCALPTMHIAGIVIGMCLPLSQGAPTIMLPRYNPRDFLQAVHHYRVTFSQVAPSVISFLAKHPMVDKFDVSSFTSILSGAAALSKELTTAFIERLKINGLQQGYGMTEASPATHVSPRGFSKHGSVGVPLPLTRSKIVDPVTGADLGPGEEGEVCVKGPQVMMGYLNNRTSTQAAFTSDAWLRTGDLGFYDDDGCYYIIDRLKDIIKFKGYQISPCHLENIILNHPDVEDAAVVGIPTKGVGEVPRAFVVAKPSVTEKDLIDLVASHVAPYRHLRGGVEFVENVPRNPSGKILRRVLRDRNMSRQEREKVWGN